MTKESKKDVQGTQATNDANVENAQVVEVKEQTAEQIKAERIIRKKLSGMTDVGLNFNRRAGSFYEAVMVAETDAEGNEIKNDKGEVMKKLARLTVDTSLPKYAGEETQAAIAIKLNAALVADGEEKYSKISEKVDKLAKELDEAKNELASFETNYEAAVKAVTEYDLPEAPTRATSAVKAQLEDMKAQNERLRAQLIAAGIDPDAVMGA